MLFSKSNPFFKFYFKPFFESDSIYCAFKIEYENNYKNYFHNIIKSPKLVKMSKPFILFKNDFGKNQIFYLKFYNSKLIYRSNWHYELISVYDSIVINSENPILNLLFLLILIFGQLILIINKILFKIFSFIKDFTEKESQIDRYGVYDDFYNIIEKKYDNNGRLVFLRQKYFSEDEDYVREMEYDLENNKYSEIFINPYDQKKYKLVVFPYYDEDKKPYWYKSFNESWRNCMIFEVENEDRLLYIMAKTKF